MNRRPPRSTRTDTPSLHDSLPISSIIVSIIGVETLYGRDMGSFRVLDALATLAFDYPDPNKPERADMFRGQLGDFITLALQDKLALDTQGSYAGTTGMPHFMPGSIKRYAGDGCGDGQNDRANSMVESVMAIRDFMREYGREIGQESRREGRG